MEPAQELPGCLLDGRPEPVALVPLVIAQEGGQELILDLLAGGRYPAGGKAHDIGIGVQVHQVVRISQAEPPQHQPVPPTAPRYSHPATSRTDPEQARAAGLDKTLSIIVIIDCRCYRLTIWTGRGPSGRAEGDPDMTTSNERDELTEPLASVTRFFGGLMIIAALIGTGYLVFGSGTFGGVPGFVCV